MEWQPIETAPNDWSGVLLYESCADRNNDVGEGYFASTDYDGDGEWHWENNDIAHPTHWMHLPPAPVQL